MVSMIVTSVNAKLPVHGLTNGYYTASFEPLDKKKTARTVPVIINK
jgi:hypothetical protein